MTIYGIDISSLKQTDEFYEKLLKLFKNTNPELPGIRDPLKDFEDYKSKSHDENPSELESFKDYLEALDSDGTDTSLILTEIINKREHLKLAVYDDVIGCPYTVPWETPNCMMNLTESEFTYKLNSYINYLWPGVERTYFDYNIE